MRTLYHIVLLVPTSSEFPGAKREERIYTVFGKAAAWRKYRWLAERWPNCVAEPVAVSPETREPICG